MKGRPRKLDYDDIVKGYAEWVKTPGHGVRGFACECGVSTTTVYKAHKDLGVELPLRKKSMDVYGKVYCMLQDGEKMQYIAKACGVSVPMAAYVAKAVKAQKRLGVFVCPKCRVQVDCASMRVPCEDGGMALRPLAFCPGCGELAEAPRGKEAANGNGCKCD